MEAYFDIVKANTEKPTGKKTEWAVSSTLCMMFVEFRPKDTIKYNLWNHSQYLWWWRYSTRDRTQW
jgi:hypothetical protein